MAKFDWQTTADALELELVTATGTDAAIAQDIFDALYQWGLPYDAAFSPAISSAKDDIQAERAAALADWSTATELCHNQTAAALNIIEADLNQPVTTFKAFDPSALAGKLALFDFTSRIGHLSTGLHDLAGDIPVKVETDQPTRDVLSDYRKEISDAYNARPDGTEGSSDFTTILILVPGVGNRTIEQAENFLIRKEAEGARLLLVI
jgi:hypothetical protein